MEYRQPPSKTALLLKAALKTTNPYALSVIETMGLPVEKHTLKNQLIQADKVDGFNRVCGWKHQPEQQVHPCFLHVLAFPLHLSLMVQKSFAFKLLGLVHLHNEIQQIRPLKVGERVDISCHFSQLEKHEKGWLFTINTEVTSDQVCVWRSHSSNLYRCSHGQLLTGNSVNIEPEVNFVELEKWSLQDDVGRAYGAVSGDYNLIHLYPLTARLFGFKSHISHGMYNKARCISALSESLGEAFTVTTTFKKPVFLPANVSFQIADKKALKYFQLHSSDGDHLHLQGTLARQQRAV